MSGIFSRGDLYSPDLTKALDRLDGLIDWERRSRVRGAARLMRVSSAPARTLLARLGLQKLPFPCVHITGSKGKGSVSSLIAFGLSSASTGVYSSPHVERVNERLSIRGRPVSDASLALALTRTLDARAQPPVVEEATWFDVMTAAALAEFARAGVDHAVVEAGMGGRRDATAVVRARVCVVTNVHDEHAEIIGPAREDIAREKAGVIAPGATAIVGLARDDAVARVFADEAASLSPPARVVLVPPEEGAPLFEHNLALARAALKPLGRTLAEDDARRCLRGLPARQEKLAIGEGANAVDVVLDGAHIPTSVAAVLREAGAAGGVVVLGVGADKKAKEICEVVREARVKHVVATAAGEQDVYMPADAVAGAMRATGFDARCVSVEKCAVAAVRSAVAMAGGLSAVGRGKVVVVGSLHVAGIVRGELRSMMVERREAE